MPKLTFDITMSLDGFVAGPNIGREHPLGEGGERLHEWAFAVSGSAPGGADAEVLDAMVSAPGAFVMGRGMFGGGPEPWGDKVWGDAPWAGWWGEEPPYHKPVFVLTHHARAPLALGETTFTFVTDGIESALEQARVAAGEKDVALGGGAHVAQQCLRAGLLDELHIHLVPVLLGGGVRLFDHLGTEHVELEGAEVIASDAVTHLRYRVVK